MHYIDEITSALNGIDDINVLDRMLSLLTQAASSNRIPTHDTTQRFTVKDHFVPAQKNEIQLQFKRTCTNPGRKAKLVIMRYNKLLLCINRYNRIVVVQVTNKVNIVTNHEERRRYVNKIQNIR